MRQRGQAANAHGIARTLNRMGDALSNKNVLVRASAMHQAFNCSRELLTLHRQFLQQAVEQFTVGIGGNGQRNVFWIGALLATGSIFVYRR